MQYALILIHLRRWIGDRPRLSPSWVLVQSLTIKRGLPPLRPVFSGEIHDRGRVPLDAGLLQSCFEIGCGV